MKYPASKFSFRALYVTAMLAAFLALPGCSGDRGPTPGRVIEEKSIKSGDLEIILRRHKEGGWGAPSDGEHYYAYCRSPKTRFCGQGECSFGHLYMLPPGLLRDLPIERFHIINNRVAWGSVHLETLFVTFSACEIAYVWRLDMLPTDLRDQTRLDLSGFPETLFQSATYDPSTGIRVSLNPNWFKNRQKITVARNHLSPWEVILDDKGIDQEAVPKK